MKKLISFLSLVLISSFCISQNVINDNTSISRTIGVNESFELKFEDSPGAGYSWYLPWSQDTTHVKIRLKKQEPKSGILTVGGIHISTYEYTGLTTGTFLIRYVYGRPWLKEERYKCNLTIIVK